MPSFMYESRCKVGCVNACVRLAVRLTIGEVNGEDGGKVMLARIVERLRDIPSKCVREEESSRRRATIINERWLMSVEEEMAMLGSDKHVRLEMEMSLRWSVEHFSRRREK